MACARLATEPTWLALRSVLGPSPGSKVAKVGGHDTCVYEACRDQIDKTSKTTRGRRATAETSRVHFLRGQAHAKRIEMYNLGPSRDDSEQLLYAAGSYDDGSK